MVDLTQIPTRDLLQELRRRGPPSPPIAVGDIEIAVATLLGDAFTLDELIAACGSDIAKTDLHAQRAVGAALRSLGFDKYITSRGGVTCRLWRRSDLV